MKTFQSIIPLGESIEISYFYPSEYGYEADYDEETELWSAHIYAIVGHYKGHTLYSMNLPIYKNATKAILALHKIVEISQNALLIMSN